MRTLLLSLALTGLLIGCQTTPPPRPRATPANALGNAALGEGRYKEASEHYASWLVNHPQDFTCQYHHAIALEMQGELDLAVEGYSKALELNREHLPARMRRANTYFRGKAYDQADQDLNEVMGDKAFTQMDPHDQVMAYALAGQIALGKKLPSIALDHLETAVELARRHKKQVRAGQYKRLLYNRAMALFLLNAYQMALEDFTEYARVHQEQGMGLTPNDMYHLVLLNYLSGQFKQAAVYLAHVPRVERRRLSDTLDDPAFFLGDPSVAATTTSQR